MRATRNYLADNADSKMWLVSEMTWMRAAVLRAVQGMTLGRKGDAFSRDSLLLKFSENASVPFPPRFIPFYPVLSADRLIVLNP